MHPSRHLDSIRLTVIMLLITCGGLQITSAQNNLTFDPYPVFIAQDETFARCGPSEEFYRTDPLRHGQELEVYAETDDGWLGIRPPQDSFCWIPADTVEMDSEAETGTIIEDKTVAWIGTHLGRARTYRWQVQLAKGEPVTVIGKSEREGPDGPQLWYRIVPPSGEYRWVHRDQIVTSSEELVASIRRQSSEPNIESVANGHSSENQQAKSTTTQTQSTAAQSTAAQPSRTASSRRSRPATQSPEPMLTDRSREPELADRSPEPMLADRSREPELAESSGQSVLQPPSTIGSGLNQSWQPNEVRQSVEDATQRNRDVAESGSKTVTEAMKKSGLLAAVEFLGRPRLLEIGGGPAAPSDREKAGESNWISGTGRSTIVPSARNVAAAAPITQPVSGARFHNPQANLLTQAGLSTPSSWSIPSSLSRQSGLGSQPDSIMQASAQSPITPANAVSNSLPTVAPAMHTLREVSADRIAQIEAETRGADGERLSLIFSRLMAARATAAEVEPLARAARQLASTSPDAVVAGRARLLAERVEQYHQVATRRDGEAVIRNTDALTIHAGQTLFGSSVSQALGGAMEGGAMEGGTMGGGTMEGDSPGAESSSLAGYLVQVYSARSNSPPFALTDNTGRTVAYVTPSPGVNLRSHLNSRVNVSGTQGFLTGLNTPHILATQVIRTPE